MAKPEGKPPTLILAIILLVIPSIIDTMSSHG